MEEDDGAETLEPHTYVTLELAGQVFAVDVGNVREILDLQPISRLPNAPADLLGMIDVRGEGIAVIDLPSQLGLMHQANPEDARIVVFELGPEPRKPIGVIADRVLSVVAIAKADIEPAPDAMSRWRSDAMIGVARIDGQLTMMLALDRLFGVAASGLFDFA
ncbi:chemotaxis protein CheW [Paracoccus methylarcula]|uniref:Chemotaxis protein CheW n=2 Tax=Paracoccus methylarcula TaxID=72022 RepID=A0A422QTL6_9RHOB|nr:chemotaxis protein CheW [Paracoccus methylarcula]